LVVAFSVTALRQNTKSTASSIDRPSRDAPVHPESSSGVSKRPLGDHQRGLKRPLADHQRGL
jgi:hypothetical protein